MSGLLKIIVVVIICYILYKLGILKITLKNNYTYVKRGKSVKVSYKKLHGIEPYNFWLKRDHAWIFRYEVAVDQGALRVKVKNFKGCVFQKEFVSDDKGTFTFDVNGRYHWVEVKGDKTKGSFYLDFTRANQKKSKNKVMSNLDG